MDYRHNAYNVLLNVNNYIEQLTNEEYKWNKKLSIRKVCDELSIFDWFKNELSISNLKDMRTFLKEAIKLGYSGYVCFKVGASGCANGMWAYKETSTNGYAPNCDCIYKSFTPSYNYWSYSKNEEFFPIRKEFNILKTIKDFEKFYKENY